MGDEAVVRAFLSAMRRRRLVKMVRLSAPDIELPAHSPRIGGPDHRERWAAVRATARIAWLSRGTLRIEPESFPGADGRVNVDARVTARSGAQRLDHRMRFSFLVRGGRVAEIREHAFDPGAWHAFWG